MAFEEPNRLVEWYQAMCQYLPTLRRRFRDWLEHVRAEPALLWATPAVRYGAYGVGAIVVAWCVAFAVELLTPPPPAGARPEATTADFHVVCERPSCRHHFVIHRDFGFHAFPLQCPRCEKRSGVAARRCNTATCAGRWVAPVSVEGKKQCPICNNVFP